MFQITSGLSSSAVVARIRRSSPAAKPAARSTRKISGASRRSGVASSTPTPGRRQLRAIAALAAALPHRAHRPGRCRDRRSRPPAAAWRGTVGRCEAKRSLRRLQRHAGLRRRGRPWHRASARNRRRRAPSAPRPPCVPSKSLGPVRQPAPGSGPDPTTPQIARRRAQRTAEYRSPWRARPGPRPGRPPIPPEEPLAVSRRVPGRAACRRRPGYSCRPRRRIPARSTWPMHDAAAPPP